MAEFVLGFLALAEELGAGVVGDPLEDEREAAGLTVQATSRGLMVYSAPANRAGFLPFALPARK